MPRSKPWPAPLRGSGARVHRTRPGSHRRHLVASPGRPARPPIVRRRWARGRTPVSRDIIRQSTLAGIAAPRRRRTDGAGSVCRVASGRLSAARPHRPGRARRRRHRRRAGIATLSPSAMLCAPGRQCVTLLWDIDDDRSCGGSAPRCHRAWGKVDARRRRPADLGANAATSPSVTACTTDRHPRRSTPASPAASVRPGPSDPPCVAARHRGQPDRAPGLVCRAVVPHMLAAGLPGRVNNHRAGRWRAAALCPDGNDRARTTARPGPTDRGDQVALAAEVDDARASPRRSAVTPAAGKGTADVRDDGRSRRSPSHARRDHDGTGFRRSAKRSRRWGLAVLGGLLVHHRSVLTCPAAGRPY